MSLAGVPEEEVELEIVDQLGAVERLRNWKYRNPYCVSFKMPGEFGITVFKLLKDAK